MTPAETTLVSALFLVVVLLITYDFPDA